MTLSTDYIKNVCKIGQGQNCCRYLLCGSNGFKCGKLSALKETIDNRVKYMSAQADNCEGVNNHDD